MSDIDVTFCGLDSLVIRCDGYDDKNDYEKAFMMAWLYSLVGEKVTRNTLKKFEDELQKKPEKPQKKKKGEIK